MMKLYLYKICREKMMQVVNIGGEEYYSVDKVYEFIELCNKRNKCIFSIEFFDIRNGHVIPCECLQSIDSVELFDEANIESTNAVLCNSFVKDCIDKVFDKLEKKYFCAVIE